VIKPSRKLLYAIEAVLDIAYHSVGIPVQSCEITRRQGIPRRYLEQTLQSLVRAGILTGMRGPKGGYRLARERRKITLGEIVRVVRATETAEDIEGYSPQSDLGSFVLKPLWGELTDEVMERLNAITVDEMCTRAYRHGVQSEADHKLDFNI
jgi:Rrf2 family protein